MKPLDLARWIITESKQTLSNLELQKVLWFLELKHRIEYGEPLMDGVFSIKICEKTGATLGIINDEIYWEYRRLGASSIKIDAPMQFKEKMGYWYCEKKVGWIGWMDKNIRWLCAIKYFCLVDAMFKKGGLVEKRLRNNDQSDIKEYEIGKEAKKMFGDGGYMVIDKPKYRVVEDVDIEKPKKEYASISFKRIFFISFFAWIFWRVLTDCIFAGFGSY